MGLNEGSRIKVTEKRKKYFNQLKISKIKLKFIYLRGKKKSHKALLKMKLIGGGRLGGLGRDELLDDLVGLDV